MGPREVLRYNTFERLVISLETYIRFQKMYFCLNNLNHDLINPTIDRDKNNDYDFWFNPQLRHIFQIVLICSYQIYSQWFINFNDNYKLLCAVFNFLNVKKICVDHVIHLSKTAKTIRMLIFFSCNLIVKLNEKTYFFYKYHNKYISKHKLSKQNKINEKCVNGAWTGVLLHWSRNLSSLTYSGTNTRC